MNLAHFASELLKQCDELEYYRHRCAVLEEEVRKYQQHVTESVNHWDNTYANILVGLVDK